MKLSIITPCSRPYNLPVIYKSICNTKEHFDSIEWIIVYDSEKKDERIKVYEDQVEIKLFNYIRQEGDPMAALIRNVGLKQVTGDLIIYLDDDNIVHPLLFQYIKKYYEYGKILVFNCLNEDLSTRMQSININELRLGYLDTAQFIIPSIYKDIEWSKEEYYSDETPYLKAIINKYGKDVFKCINQVVTYRNYIKRNPV